MTWVETYEHSEYGEIELTWAGSAPDRYRLIALQADLWTPQSEVDDCLQWAARNTESPLGVASV